MSTLYAGMTDVTLTILVRDADGNAINLAVVDEVVLTLTDERRGTRVLSHSFVTDGTDGLIQAAIPDNTLKGNPRKLTWQVKLTTSGTTTWTSTDSIQVVKPLG